MVSQIQSSLRGYRNQMIIQLVISATIVLLATVVIVRKLIHNSKWLTAIGSLLLLAEICIALAAIVYYSQYDLLWANFPTPPTQSVVTEAQKLLCAFDWFSELYYASITIVYTLFAGLVWISSTRVYQLHFEGMLLSNGPKTQTY